MQLLKRKIDQYLIEWKRNQNNILISLLDFNMILILELIPFIGPFDNLSH